MRILFVGAFDWKSTNFSQEKALLKMNIDVISYAYRDKQLLYGNEKRDNDLIETCKRKQPDFVLISKGNGINIRAIHEINKIAKTVLWFADAPIISNWDSELEEKIKYCNYVFCEKKEAVELAKNLNKNVYQLTEGFDPEIHLPIEGAEQDINISFIGTAYGDRKYLLPEGTNIFSKVYGLDHSKHVCRSKINLNFCTTNTVSNRVFKILAAKGFLLTDDWDQRDEIFEDKKDLVIFYDKKDLEEKAKYYLEHENERKQIAENGWKTVQKYSKNNWAKDLLNIITSGKFKIRLASYIIVYREADRLRKRNLMTLLEYISKFDFEIIIVEQDKEQHFKNSLFVYNPGLFNRSWGFNVGAIKSTCNKLIFSDCDLLMNIEDIKTCLDDLKSFQAIDPKGSIINLQDGESVENNSKTCRTGFDFAGGIVFMDRKAFFKISGWDEDIRGWGVEDNLMSFKIKKMISHKRDNYLIHHLYHRDFSQQMKLQLSYKQNVQHFGKIKAMNRQQICEYYTNREIGNINKYR